MQRVTKRQKLKKAMAFQHLGLEAPAGSLLYVERPAAEGTPFSPQRTVYLACSLSEACCGPVRRWCLSIHACAEDKEEDEEMPRAETQTMSDAKPQPWDAERVQQSPSLSDEESEEVKSYKIYLLLMKESCSLPCQGNVSLLPIWSVWKWLMKSQ